MNKSRNVILVRMDEGDKLVITSFDPCSLYYIPVEAAGDKCVLGESSSQTLNYAPRGLCVDYQQNLVVLDDRNKSLYFYNSSEDEVMTMKLPSGVDPVYVCADHFGGYVVTDKEYHQITWINATGKEMMCHKDKAHGISFSGLRGIVRDKEGRFIVADFIKNKLLLFSNDGGDVRSVIEDKITKPYSLYLDHQQDQLYVGTWSGQVVVYDYYVLLGEKHNIKYNTTKLGIKSILLNS